MSTTATIEEVQEIPEVKEVNLVDDAAAAPAPEAAAAQAAESTSEAAADTTTAPAAAATPAAEDDPTKVKLTNIVNWLGRAIAPGITITASDIRCITTLVLWTFLDKHHVPADGVLEGLEKITSDDSVAISQDEMIRIAGIVFNQSFRSYFRNISLL